MQPEVGFHGEFVDPCISYKVLNKSYMAVISFYKSTVILLWQLLCYVASTWEDRAFSLEVKNLWFPEIFFFCF